MRTCEMRMAPLKPRSLLVVAVVFSVGHPFAQRILGAADDGVEAPIVFAQVPAGTDIEGQPAPAAGMLRADYGDGGRIVRLDGKDRLRVLTEGFSAACEPDVSFDGKRILFSGKRKPADSWDIWEMNADGSDVRRITKDLGNCRSPAYQSTLYTIVSTEPWYQIMFVSDAAGSMNEYGSGPSRALYSCKLDGSAVRRLSFNLSDDMDPFLMDDGRVLFANWQRMGLRRGLPGRVVLSGVNTDGADFALFCGDQGKRVKHMPCVTADGLAVFVEADRVPWDGAGQLGSVSLRRNLYSYRPLSQEPGKLYHSPSPLHDGRVLVSCRPADGSGNHAVCRLDPGSGKSETLFDAPDLHDIHAKSLAPRPKPDGRSSVVDEKRTTGKLYCLDVRLTEPDIIPHMRPAMVQSIRVIEGVPVSAGKRKAYLPTETRIGISGPGSTVNGIPPVVQKRLLGQIPIEEDGSFNIEIPADVPVQLQSLDAQGMALQTCGWIWAKPREPRGCIGCHEDPELTPENRFVGAVQRPAMKLTLPADKRRTVDFRRDVMPIINEKCAPCHPGRHAELDLRAERGSHFNRAYESLLAGDEVPAAGDKPVAGKYVHPGQARTSPLIWRLFGRNTSRPWDESCRAKGPSRACPLPDAKPLTDDEKLTFVEWIDLGAHWDGIPGAEREGAK